LSFYFMQPAFSRAIHSIQPAFSRAFPGIRASGRNNSVTSRRSAVRSRRLPAQFAVWPLSTEQKLEKYAAEPETAHKVPKKSMV
jgi:hypothetical protein